ncbi:MAG: hypothetical protein IJ213_01710 [Bacteroidales bacterium]|nr:hypothetical protein [Bacteroidales bacterium]
MDSVFKQTVMLMDKTRIDYDYDKKKSVRRSNNPALQRELDEYNTTEAVRRMRERKKRQAEKMSNDEIAQQMRENIENEKKGV